MRFNKIILLAILLSVLTVGSVSAADDNSTNEIVSIDDNSNEGIIIENDGEHYLPNEISDDLQDDDSNDDQQILSSKEGDDLSSGPTVKDGWNVNYGIYGNDNAPGDTFDVSEKPIRITINIYNSNPNYSPAGMTVKLNIITPEETIITYKLPISAAKQAGIISNKFDELGIYTVTVESEGYNFNNPSTTFEIIDKNVQNKIESWVDASSIKTYYGSGKNFRYYLEGDVLMTVDNGKSVIYKKSYTDECGNEFSYSLKSLSPGSYNVKFYNDENKVIKTAKITITKSTSKLTVNSFKVISGSKYTLKAYLKDKNTGKNYNGETVIFKINGKSYSAKVKNGVASIKFTVPKKVKSYDCTAKFNGNKYVTGITTKFKMTVNPVPIKTKVNAPAITVKQKDNKNFAITVKDLKGKPIKNLKLNVKIGNKVYSVKTNKKGVAYFNTKNLAPGSYKVAISSANVKFSVSKSSKITVKKLPAPYSVVLNLKVNSMYYSEAKLKTGDVLLAATSSYERQHSKGITIGTMIDAGQEGQHSTKLINAKVWYKNKNTGKIITKTQTATKDGYNIKVLPWINGYTPYKAQVWYRHR